MGVPLKPLSTAFLLEGAAPALPSSPATSLEARAPVDATALQARLEGWFKDHFDTLWRLAARLGVPDAHVDDVVQEAFIIAARRADEIELGSERSFLIGIVVRSSANQRRRQKTRLDYVAGSLQQPSAGSPADAEQLLAQKQLRQLLDEALDALPGEQRSVLVLHEIEGFSTAEISALLDLPAGTVASRLGRARAKFSKAAARLRAKWPQHR